MTMNNTRGGLRLAGLVGAASSVLLLSGCLSSAADYPAEDYNVDADGFSLVADDLIREHYADVVVPLLGEAKGGGEITKSRLVDDFGDEYEIGTTDALYDYGVIPFEALADVPATQREFANLKEQCEAQFEADAESGTGAGSTCLVELGGIPDDVERALDATFFWSNPDAPLDEYDDGRSFVAYTYDPRYE